MRKLSIERNLHAVGCAPVKNVDTAVFVAIAAVAEFGSRLRIEIQRRPIGSTINHSLEPSASSKSIIYQR
jgi:hypothetical protein